MGDVADKLLDEHNTVFQEVQFYEKALMITLKGTLTIYEADTEKVNSYAEDFIRFFREKVIVHFRVEEEAVFPELRGENTVEELLKEHHEILANFKNLTAAKDAEAKVKLLKGLMDMLRTHAKKENEQLLPLMRTKIPAEKLKEIEEKAQKIHKEKS